MRAQPSSSAREAPTDSKMLDRLQWESFQYFLRETNPDTGLVTDKTRERWPASIAAIGLALAAYPVGVERGFIERGEAASRIATTLEFLWKSPQGTEADAAGYNGFFYHFLDMGTGRRVWSCELSTVDTAFLFAGALTAAVYFDREEEQEQRIRRLAHGLYERADWRWALNGGATLTHGWKPESGFLRHRWRGYDEALLLYALALGSPTSPIPEESYSAWLSTYRWKKIYGYELVYAGPLFVHQLSHVWIDFRQIHDAFMREKGIDYFENTRRATYVQREYAIRNPRQFELYGGRCWGLSASDGPGPATLRIGDVKRIFFEYFARGAPFGPDDGTIAPWAVVASLPFAPEIVLPALRYFIEDLRLEDSQEYGFKAAFNGTYSKATGDDGPWISPWIWGLDEGPILLMIENYRSGLPWELTRRCAPVVAGLRRAGFIGGWL